MTNSVMKKCLDFSAGNKKCFRKNVSNHVKIYNLCRKFAELYIFIHTEKELICIKHKRGVETAPPYISYPIFIR